MIDIELQRTRSAMAESVTLPIAMWLDALDELEALRQTRLVQQAEQKPVAWASFDNAYSKACNSSNPQDWMEAALLAQQIRTAHVRTKDLTDGAIWEILETHPADIITAIRAVIAADREKNNGL